jgi:type IV pilus assembly protein PilO
MSLRDPRTQKILLTAVVSVIVLWSFFFSDLLPIGYRRRAAESAKLKGEYESLAAELEKARRTVDALPRLEQENDELQRRWQEAQQLLPTDKEMARLLSQITQSGEEAGVGFELFKPGAPKPQEFYNENPIEVEVSCGYHQLGIFLSRLANLPRIVNISQLKLDGYDQKESEKKEEEGREDHTLKANFLATAYSLRDPAAAPEEAPPAEPSAERKIRTGKRTRAVAEAEAAAGGKAAKTSKTGGKKP